MEQRNQPHLLKGRARLPQEWSKQQQGSETANLPATWTNPDLSALVTKCWNSGTGVHDHGRLKSQTSRLLQ